MKNIFNLLILFSTIIAFQACSGNKEETPVEVEPTETAINVKLGLVSTTSQAMKIISTGALTPKDQIRMSFKIGGVISEIYVQEGQSVKKGQLLARLDKTEIDVHINKAKIALQKAERDLKRAESMYADTVATLEIVENATTGRDIAASNLNIAKFNQEYVNLYAPTNGKVLMRLAEPQELTGPGNPVLVLTPVGKSQVMKVGLADKDIVKVRLGDKAIVTFDAYAGEQFNARITELPELPDQQTGSFPVEFTVQSKGKKLKNGFIGKIEITPSSSATFYKIPIEALAEVKAGTAYIYVPDSQKKTAKRIAVIPQEIGKDYFTIVKNNAFSLDEVITAGVAYLSDGAEIKVQ